MKTLLSHTKTLPWRRILLIAGPTLLILALALILAPKRTHAAGAAVSTAAPVAVTAPAVTPSPVVIPAAELEPEVTPLSTSAPETTPEPSPAATTAPAQPLSYTPISDIRETTEVKTVTELPVAEVKPTQDTITPADVETLSTPSSEEAVILVEDENETILIGGESEVTAEPVETEAGPGLTVTQTTPVVNEEGLIAYTYEYKTGENGFLLLTDGTESDVMPVEEEGQIAYGLRRVVTVLRSDEDGITEVEDGVIPDEPEEGVEYFTEESSETVTLLNGDGTPVDGYQITAIAATETVTIPIGWREENDKTYYYDTQGQKVTGLKQIDGKLYYFDDDGVKASSLGVDVSYFNGQIDWEAVKAQGIDFVIVRLAGRTWGSGILFEDTSGHLEAARAAGLKVGAYVYSAAVTTDEAVEEASLAVELLGGAPLDLPLYIDLEFSGEYPNGRADRLNAQQRTEIAQAFCATVANAGYTPGVYAGQNFFYESINFSALMDYRIWLASYTVEQRLPSFRHRYDLWQCTSTAAVDGIGSGVDLNVVF